jgi:hypothetical protein
MSFLRRARPDFPLLVSIGIHSLAGAWLARKPSDAIVRRAAAVTEIAVDLLEPTENVDDAAPGEGNGPPAPTPIRRAPTPRRRPPAPAPSASSAPPPLAAQAAPVATAPETTATAETAVTGDAAVHAGGVTQTGATSPTAVVDPNARAWGVPGGTGADGDGWLGGIDLSRKASLGGNRYWTCPYAFVGENEAFQGTTVVRLRADVAADGMPQSFEVVDAPSPAFAVAATRCAKAERFVPARDRRGRSTRGTTNPFRVVFSRF